MSKPTVIKSGALCKSCGAWLPFESHGTYCGNFGSLGIGNRPNGETMTTQKTPDEVAKNIVEEFRPHTDIDRYDALMEHTISEALRDAREAALEDAAELLDDAKTHFNGNRHVYEDPRTYAQQIRAIKKGKA